MTSLALRNHSEFVEVIDSHAGGALGAGSREESDIAGYIEVVVAVRANDIITDYLVWEAAGNHRGMTNDEAIGAPEVEISVAKVECGKGYGIGFFQVGIFH